MFKAFCKARFVKQFKVMRSRFFAGNRFRISPSSHLRIGAASIKQTTVSMAGAGNTVDFDDCSSMIRCRIRVSGNDNRIVIDENAYLIGVDLVIEGDRNSIVIAARSRIYENSHLAAMEGTNLRIGENCMIAGECQFRTGDSHSVVDANGVRLNPSSDIVIADHVWVGLRVICLGGATIASHTIVGAASLVNSPNERTNVVLAGSPARVVKEGVNWRHERV